MRTYSCYYYKRRNNILIRIHNNACWAGINNSNIMWYEPKKRKNKWSKSNIPKSIYIKYYNYYSDKDTLQLVKLINLITPCKIVKFKKKKYIKYDFLNLGYNHELLLLNFIRCLWYSPNLFNILNFFNSLHSYKKEDDVLYFLTKCLKENVLIDTNDKGYGYGYGDHSSVYRHIIPKTTNYFLEATFDSIQSFLTEKMK